VDAVTAHGKTAEQSLRLLVQQDIVVIARTSRSERLAENLAISTSELSPPPTCRTSRSSRRNGRVVDYAYSGSSKWD
jgi:2,5-diketo-D-gluconate reductase B